MIEFDLRRTKDGVLVIMHDSDVARTTDGTGCVADLTLSEIRELDAGIHKGDEFAGTRVPTLEETLEMMPHNIWLNCELKERGEESGRDAARAIRCADRMRQAFLACRGDAREAARRIEPEILVCNMERQPTVEEYIAETIRMNANFIQFNRGYEFSRAELLPLKNRNIRINYFRARTPGELAGLFDLGVDFVLVDELKEFIPTVEAFGVRPVQPPH